MTASRGALVLRLAAGGEAVVLETDGNVVTLHSTLSAPPGMPLEGTSPDGQKYTVKVRGSRRDGDDGDGKPRFLVEGRWVNLSRAQRLTLVGK